MRESGLEEPSPDLQAGVSYPKLTPGHHAHNPARYEENREFVLQKIGEGDIPKI